MVKWTDSRSAGVNVKGGGAPPQEKHCRIVELSVPSEAEVNKNIDVRFVCHIDKGTNVVGCMAIENCSGNPSEIIITIDREYRVQPGYMLWGCLDKGYNTCTRYQYPRLLIRFPKTGRYTLKFYAGYQ